jgi:secreted trypsin-like serine protease
MVGVFPEGIPGGNRRVEVPELGKIIGGETADRGEWPWQCALYYNGNFNCGGILIGTRAVLTAAHCVQSCATAQQW